MNNSHRRKIIKLFLLSIVVFITAIVLIVETYAWFVGITTVNVNQFNVTIKAGEGLELSLDASTWTNSSLTVSESAVTGAYDGSGNVWPANLTPVSTNGQLTSSTARLNLYQKASLIPTAGGYKIVASKLNNGTTEQDGYIAFNLFIRNGTGSQYDNQLNFDGFESVYLTSNSKAEKLITGSANYGLANSVRVGFFEIAPTQVSSSATTIRNLGCTIAGSSLTLCASSANLSSWRTTTWNIWEPNHTTHTSALASYIAQVCKTRGSGGAYTSTACAALGTSQAVNTYAINQAISSSHNVDIYDGYNGYTSSRLTQMTTYKTPASGDTGNSRESLIKLPANMITKVRVYIWLEGQDIDNYDVATNDTGVKIQFGLTKNRNGI